MVSLFWLRYAYACSVCESIDNTDVAWVCTSVILKSVEVYTTLPPEAAVESVACPQTYIQQKQSAGACMHHMHMFATNVQVRLKHQNSNNSTLI